MAFSSETEKRLEPSVFFAAFRNWQSSKKGAVDALSLNGDVRGRLTRITQVLLFCDHDQQLRITCRVFGSATKPRCSQSIMQGAKRTRKRLQRRR